MKLASVFCAGRDCIAALDDAGRLVELAGGMTMLQLIEGGAGALESTGEALAVADKARILDPGAVRWRPPVPRPGKILGVAMNNSASNERKISAPGHPAFFLKPSSCLVGHGQPILIRRYYGSVHPEPELAVVMGSRARDVAPDEALDHVFGYSIFNDITGNGMRAEDLFHYWALYADPSNPGELERREQHLSYAARYKGSDTFGAMGPFLVTRGEIDDPDDLEVSCKAGGETIAEDSTRYYNYKVPELISYISQFMTLEPGDVISCGTAFKPSANRRSIHQANLQAVPGPVEVSISGLGTLVNPVEIDERPLGRWRLAPGP